MASAIYPKAKEQFMQAGLNMNTGVIRAVLIDTGTYTYSAAHVDYADLTGIVGSESDPILSKTFTNGTFDGADITFSTVSGSPAEALVLFLDTGTAANDLLIAFIDSDDVTGLPVTPNGGDIDVSWNISGIFTL